NYYNIHESKVSHGGQYWCRAGRGDPVYYTQYSNVVWVNVTDGDVILESPVHPVTEGDPLTLRCRYRNQPFDISADFYKDGTLLHTSSTGEMTVPAVSKSHEGLYKCKSSEKGESPESWITVKDTDFTNVVGPSGSFPLVLVIVIIGLIILGITTPLLLHHHQKIKRLTGQTAQSGQKQGGTNHTSDQDQNDPAGGDGTQSQYMPLQRGTSDVYNSLNTDYINLQQSKLTIL
ncbi:high affinity immunoglobulin gamma Fc receptor I-like, partial [Engraulis encrasicolus]|uniref:high affinity immunoglobulin gamma Fc receptor I-like n=1 Tax=Engraulis encrasicolus TaxID=184585 RepID=UPI002FD5D569